MFAQWLNQPMTNFSECVPVVKQHMTIYVSICMTRKYYSKRKELDEKDDLLHNSIYMKF